MRRIFLKFSENFRLIRQEAANLQQKPARIRSERGRIPFAAKGLTKGEGQEAVTTPSVAARLLAMLRHMVKALRTGTGLALA